MKERKMIILNMLYMCSDYPSFILQNELKRKLGCSLPTLRKDLRELEESGYINIINSSCVIIEPINDIRIRNKIISSNIEGELVVKNGREY
ncbi:MAG: HTH domain-containing protein [Spirochaetia bacterium]|nr:HTH domain-containing protein [Spirochaetia bacterium]